MKTIIRFFDVNSMYTCPECDRIFENENELEYSEYYEMYVCKQCIKNIQYKNDPDMERCDCCKDYFEIDELSDTNDDSISIDVYNQYPNSLLCSECLNEE